MKKLKMALPFAHLLGISVVKAEEADDEGMEDDKQREGESDEEYAKRLKANKAESDDDGNDKPESDPQGSKAESEDEDEDEDEEDGKTKSRAALAERSRCARIMAAGFRLQQPRAAAMLMTDTDMTVAQAEATLAMMAGDRGPSLSERMSAVAIPKIGADASRAEPTDATERAKRQAAEILAAAARATGQA